MSALSPRQLVAAACLESGQSLAAGLAALEPATPSPALSAATEGRLEDALRALEFDATVAQAAARWPAALRPICARLHRLPDERGLRFEVYETLHWLLPPALAQWAVLAIVQVKLMPVLTQVAAGGSSWLVHAGGACRLGALALGLLCAGATAVALRGVGAADWRRWLQRAREAGVLAGVTAAGAPDEVLALQRAAARSLGDAAGATTAADLDLLAGDAALRAERSMGRAATAVKVLGVGALALLALSVCLDVYGTIAVAPEVFSP